MLPYLGYVEWSKLANLVDRARYACTNLGYDSADHFPGAGKMVDIGKGGARKVPDCHLTRFGC